MNRKFAGIFIGPLIASLFITVWELYAIAFASYLPEVYYHKRKSGPADAEAEVSQDPE